MRILDLFCKAGGAAMGLHQAFPEAQITGVDIEPQPRYPFTFVKSDAMTYLLQEYDFIWASPPCQKYTVACMTHRNNGKEYPDLVAATRVRLIETGKPWVIENVPGAPMRPDLILCGAMFGLRLVRHRWFELSGIPFSLVMPCAHDPDPVTVVGHGTPSWVSARRGGASFTQQEKREAMGIDWMNREELSQAIPPAYSRYIGEQFKKSSLQT
jgi:DNA (cytosine-5)-methyltransferase 1